jgi:hypothetical protein
MGISHCSTGHDMLVVRPPSSCSIANIGEQKLEGHGRQKLVHAVQTVRLLLLWLIGHLHLHPRCSIRPAMVRDQFASTAGVDVP